MSELSDRVAALEVALQEQAARTVELQRLLDNYQGQNQQSLDFGGQHWREHGLGADQILAPRLFVAMAAGLQAKTTSGASSVTQVETGTNKVNYWTVDFDTTTSEKAFFNGVFPPSYDGGPLYFQFYWTAASGSGTYICTMAGRSFGDNEALDQALGTAVSVTDTLQTATNVHISPVSTAVTMAGTPQAGEYFEMELVRDVSDTLGVDARLMAVVVSYGTGRFGDPLF